MGRGLKVNAQGGGRGLKIGEGVGAERGWGNRACAPESEVSAGSHAADCTGLAIARFLEQPPPNEGWGHWLIALGAALAEAARRGASLGRGFQLDARSSD